MVRPIAGIGTAASNAGSHLFGSSSRKDAQRDGLVIRIGAAVARAAGSAVDTNVAYYGALYNRTLEPQSYYQRQVGQPTVRLLSPVLRTIADSPVGDAGTWASIQGAFLPRGVFVPIMQSLRPFASVLRLAPRATSVIEGGVPLAGAAERGVWKLNSLARGQQIEQPLGHNLPGNFPVVGSRTVL